MHAGFPRFPAELAELFHLGGRQFDLPAELAQSGGRLMAKTLAILLQVGFTLAFDLALPLPQRVRQVEELFEENFVLRDPDSPGGERYYQGRFLLRTRQPGDEMNVWFGFCQEPERLYRQRLGQRLLNSQALLTTRTLSEQEAEQWQRDPERVDLVIAFKDLQALLGLVREPNVEVVGLLLENKVLITGNTSHLFKMGAIAQSLSRHLRSYRHGTSASNL